MISYKINTSSKKDLFLHLVKCNTQFVPLLSDRINIKDYAQKLNEKAVLFEAWNSKELIGVIAVYFNNKEELQSGFITNVSVLKAFEGKGIASKLLKMVKEYAVNKNFNKLSLEVHPENKKAILFYEKHNFVLKEKDENNILMNCKLKM